MDKLIIITKTMGLHQITTPKVSSFYYHCGDDKKIAKFVELTGQIICDEIMKAVDKYKNSKIVDVDYDISAPGFEAEYYVNGVRTTYSIKVFSGPAEITDELISELDNKVSKFRFKKDYIMDKFIEINERLLEED